MNSSPLDLFVALKGTIISLFSSAEATLSLIPDPINKEIDKI
ncbi:MAG: hypothetical protein ACPKPY_09975 [Nitrososphaeraceae archaeon]